MTIHKEGIPSIAIATCFVSLLMFIAFYFCGNNHFLFYLSAGVSVLLLVAILQFFRRPERNIIENVNHVFSPADGKVVAIEEVQEREFFNDKRRQISIFMSPLNVHVNWNPVGGKVKFAKYHPGKNLVAWHPKSSSENERTTFVVELENKEEIMFRQIAGAVARRIVYYIREGDGVEQGKEMGFIKFGSRVDVFLPLRAKICVSLDQEVKGCSTVIAVLD